MFIVFVNTFAINILVVLFNNIFLTIIFYINFAQKLGRLNKKQKEPGKTRL